MNTYHVSVLTAELIEYLALKPNGIYVDCTFGGGGHTRALLEADPTVHVIACDVDTDAFEHNRDAIERDFPGRVRFVWTNFGAISKSLKKIGVTQVDGIIADFGTSYHQIHEKPGFSFAANTPLDMRMSTAHTPTRASDILNNASFEELVKIFWEYGQERYSRQIARAIEAERKVRRFRTTQDLVDLIKSVVPFRRESKIHPATKVFQALRIVVNDELGSIERLLQQAPVLLKPGGRLVCISFHSLEDRPVKEVLRNNALLKVLTPRAVSPSLEEVGRNPSSRSAKLRAAERLA